MLDKIVQVLKGLAYASIAAFAISLIIFLHQARPVLTGLQNDVDEAHRVLLETALTAKEARIASTDERTYLEKTIPVITGQVSQVLKNSSAAIAGLNSDTQTLNKVLVQIGDNTTMLSADAHNNLDTLNTTLLNIQPIEEKLNNTVRDTDLLIADPQIKDAVLNVDKSTQSLAKTLDHTDKTTSDIQQSVHAILHPSWFTKLVNYATDGAKIVAPFLY